MTDITERFETGPRMSQAVKAGGFLFISGQAADDPSTGIADQTRQVLAKIDGFLSVAGTDKSQLLSATVWLDDIRDYEAMNAVWDRWIAPVAAPARACGQGKVSAKPNYLVEISAIARVP